VVSFKKRKSFEIKGSLNVLNVNKTTDQCLYFYVHWTA